MSKILIIDDEKGICEEFRDILQDDGHEVEIAHNGPDGLKKIDEKDFNLVFLDVLMPRMEGNEVFARIKKSKNVPVVIMSGFLPQNKEKDILALGAVACLRKPLNLERVRKIISEVEAENKPS